MLRASKHERSSSVSPWCSKQWAMCWFRWTAGCRWTTRWTAAAFLRCLYPPHQSWQARLWKGCCVKTCTSLGRSCHRPLLQRRWGFWGLNCINSHLTRWKGDGAFAVMVEQRPHSHHSRRRRHDWARRAHGELPGVYLHILFYVLIWKRFGAVVPVWSLMSTPAEMCFRGWSTATTRCVSYDSWPSPDADFLSDINICVLSSHNHMSVDAGTKTRSSFPGNRSWQMLLKLRNWGSGGLRTIRQVYG